MADLQFDRAEFDTPGAAGPCAACKQPIVDRFYRVNGQMVCASCLERLRAVREIGTPGARFLAASGLGFLAAIVGAGLYYGVRALTGYELGLVAIVVGVIVGMGVRKGARHRGGGGYQALAMGLTYFSIALTYLPYIVQILGKNAGQASALLIGLRVLFGFGLTLAAPVLVGTKSVMSLIILGIALYEAWKLNKRMPFEVTGPHEVAPAAPAPPPEPAPHA
jgi:hypothetical protein